MKGRTTTGPKSRKTAPRTAALGRHPAQARLAVDLPLQMHRQLKVRAASEGKTIRDYIIWLLEKDGIPGGS